MLRSLEGPAGRGAGARGGHNASSRASPPVTYAMGRFGVNVCMYLRNPGRASRTSRRWAFPPTRPRWPGPPSGSAVRGTRRLLCVGRRKQVDETNCSAADTHGNDTDSRRSLFHSCLDIFPCFSLLSPKNMAPGSAFTQEGLGTIKKTLQRKDRSRFINSSKNTRERNSASCGQTRGSCVGRFLSEGRGGGTEGLRGGQRGRDAVVGGVGAGGAWALRRPCEE